VHAKSNRYIKNRRGCAMILRKHNTISDAEFIEEMETEEVTSFAEIPVAVTASL
jgi:hypothetical protein